MNPNHIQMDKQEFHIKVREVLIEISRNESGRDDLTEEQYIDIWRSSQWFRPLRLNVLVNNAIRMFGHYGSWFTPEMCVVIIYMKVLVHDRITEENKNTLYSLWRSTNHITSREWIEIAKEIHSLGDSWFPVNMHKLYNLNKSRERVLALEEEWVLSSYICDNVIQWLPREMLEDVVALL